jgi:hypothetical protein
VSSTGTNSHIFNNSIFSSAIISCGVLGIIISTCCGFNQLDKNNCLYAKFILDLGTSNVCNNGNICQKAILLAVSSLSFSKDVFTYIFTSSILKKSSFFNFLFKNQYQV